MENIYHHLLNYAGMTDREEREHEFGKKLAEEVAGNVDDIKDILGKSKVGQSRER